MICSTRVICSTCLSFPQADTCAGAMDTQQPVFCRRLTKQKQPETVGRGWTAAGLEDGAERHERHLKPSPSQR